MDDKIIHHKYIILGGGPAGIQLAYFLKKQNEDYLILEKDNCVGAFFQDQPKHGQLISINKTHTGFDKNNPINLRWDWHSLLTEDNANPFTELTNDYFPNKKFMIEYLKNFTEKHQLNINLETCVNQIDKKNEKFFLHDTQNHRYSCDHLIIATGVSKPFIANIPGIEHTTHYSAMDLNKEIYNNKRVLIIGKGNSGFETADYLKDSAAIIHIASPSPLKFAWQTHYVGHLRAVNNNFLDTYQLKSQNGLINADIASIKKTNDQLLVTFNYKYANGETEEILYDHIIAATGFRFDSSIFTDNCKPNLAINDRFPEMTPYYESTNISNCYFAGTIMQQRDFKKKQSGFVHGFRYNVAFLAKYMAFKHNQKSLPHRQIPLTADAMTQMILERVNQTSSLWQQTGYLCDLITFDCAKNSARYQDSLPIDFVLQNYLGENDYGLIITLNFGQEIINQHSNVFLIPRVHKDDFKNAHLSTFIHPIITLVRGSEVIKTHHIIEDFESQWNEDVHKTPLNDFLYDTMEKTLLIEYQKELVE